LSLFLFQYASISFFKKALEENTFNSKKANKIIVFANAKQHNAPILGQFALLFSKG